MRFSIAGLSVSGSRASGASGPRSNWRSSTFGASAGSCRTAWSCAASPTPRIRADTRPSISAARSCLYRHRGEGRFYGADYDRQGVNLHHHGDRHEYLLAGTPLDADLFINLPKLKTHRKTGITSALKNLVGINGDKNWLPHHTDGCPADGGDERPALGWADWVEMRIKPLVQAATLQAPAARRSALPPGAPPWERCSTATVRRSATATGRATTPAGGWRWTSIARCSSPTATARCGPRAQPKRYFCIVDGIIGGEGNGPTDPEPVFSNVLIAGGQPGGGGRRRRRELMGFDDRAPAHRAAAPSTRTRCRSASRRSIDVACFDERVGAEIPVSEVQPAVPGGFRPHFGWPDVTAPRAPTTRHGLAGCGVRS